MDAHSYWYHCQTDGPVFPLAPHTVAPGYGQTPPCYFPNQTYPGHLVPPTQQAFCPPQIERQTPHLSRSRVPNPERFLGASCQWVCCNSARRTPMLACDFHFVPRCPYESQSIWASGASALRTGKAESWWIHSCVRRPSAFDVHLRLHSHNVIRYRQPVTDYRSSETGLRSHHLRGAPKIEDVRKSVRELLLGKVVVGYQLWELLLVRLPPAFQPHRISDLTVLQFLGVSHPAIDTRDVASFVPFRTSLGYKSSQTVPLKILVNKFMGRDIGHGFEHPVSISSSPIPRVVVTRSGR